MDRFSTDQKARGFQAAHVCTAFQNGDKNGQLKYKPLREVVEKLIVRSDIANRITDPLKEALENIPPLNQ